MSDGYPYWMDDDDIAESKARQEEDDWYWFFGPGRECWDTEFHYYDNNEDDS